MNPGKVVAAPDPGDNLRIGPDYHPHEPEPTALRLLEPGRLRPRRRDVLGRRGLPQDRRRDDVPELHGHPRREAHHPRPGQRPAPGDDRRAARRRALTNETLHEALDLCLQCKACKTECPSNVDMAKLKAEFLHQYYKDRPVPLGSLLMGHIHRLNPIGSATAPLANWTLQQPAVQVAPGEGGRDRPPADPADVRRDHFRRWFRRHAVDPRAGSARDGRPARRLLHDLQQPRGRPSRRCGCWRRPATASSWPACAAAAGRRSPRACSRSAATWPGRTSRSSSATPATGTPILGCEPSCLLTLVDEYRDFRLGPDADAGRRGRPPWSTRSWPTRERVPDAAARGRCEGVSCCTAIASRRRVLGTAGHDRGPAADPRPRGQGARLRLLRHGRLVRLRARPLRRERRPGQPRPPPGRRRRSRGAAWSPPASPAAARSTAWPASTPFIRSSSWRSGSMARIIRVTDDSQLGIRFQATGANDDIRGLLWYRTSQRTRS